MSTDLSHEPAPTQERRLVTSVPGPRSQALLARKTAEVGAGVGVALPAFIVQAGGGVLVDVDGNHLIDLGSGVGVTVAGNANPRVVEGVTRQVARFTHTAFFVTPYEGYLDVCAALNRLTPGDHEKRSVLFNSGAEAVENAVKVARAFTGRPAVVVLEHGFHGRTNLTLGMTSNAMPFKRGFGPFAPEVYRVPTSYPFRDGRSGPEAAATTIATIERTIRAGSVAAVVVEPVQGEGGIIVPAAGFLPALAEFCRAEGILLVADEIQAGFCRTGRWFASEHEDVVPDVVTTAKGMAGGLPLAGVTARAEVMDAVHPGGLGGTYSGNPVACAAALGAIAWMERTDAPARARAIGEILFDRLSELQERHPQIGEVRGRGAMVGIELVEADGRAPAPQLAARINRYCHEHGVVTLVTGADGNVLRFLPPLTIPDHLLHEGLDVVAEALSACAPA